VSERGSGVVGTTFGVAVFLVLLVSAAHLLVGLWQTTAVTSVARDAANEVATAPTAASPSEVEDRALRRARDALGPLASGVELRFEHAIGAPEVILHVRAPELHLVPAGAAGVVGDDGLDRRVVVRREQP